MTTNKETIARREKIVALRKQGYTVREIMKEMGMKSPSHVQYYLSQEEQGWLTRQDLRERLKEAERALIRAEAIISVSVPMAKQKEPQFQKEMAEIREVISFLKS